MEKPKITTQEPILEKILKEDYYDTPKTRKVNKNIPEHAEKVWGIPVALN